jgi:hypothetical protein
MRSPKRPSSSSSGNRADYRKAFLGHVHQLLRAGYAALTPSDFTNAEEDDITGELCKHMTYLTEVAPTSRWMARYSIHDQHPVNDVKNEKDGTARRGKRRPRLDIRIVQQTRFPKVSFSIEAKRLYRSDSTADYMDDEGLNAFVQEYYAKDDDACGMLGYVQRATMRDWAAKLEARLAKEPSVIRSVSSAPWCETATETAGVSTYLSRHKRPGTGRPLDIHHMLLLFV